jgi:hypothetical protein
MMHTIKVIAGGFVLLALCLLIGAKAVEVFIPLWLVAAGINMWVGVSKAGYSVAEEAPIFLLVFAAPTAVAVLLLWRYTRG